jgi:hypothetical protein
MQAMTRQDGWAPQVLVREPARRARPLAIALVLVFTLVPFLAGPASAAEPGNTHFLGTWQRTDLPVFDLLVNRTWMWGPEANSDVLKEPYAESPGGQRTVQYFDKSRMEITHPDGEPTSIWYVTNGLLVVELITGQMQVGDNLFEDREPAEVPVAGDLSDDEGPTYLTFAGQLDAAPAEIGDVYTSRVSRSGQVTNDPTLVAQGVTAAHLDEVTGHAVATPFWAFMNSTGLVHQGGQFVEDLLFKDPLFATGRPITEAYWAEVLIGNVPTDVLMQCFERRCLTYNPSNPEGWQVEAGNVGIHYYEWRYGTEQEPIDPPPGDPPGDPEPGDPPPGDPPPGDPPPGDPPPNDPPIDEAPSAPTNLRAEALLDDDVPFIALTWDDRADNEEGFRLYSSGEGVTILVADIGPNVESYADYDFASFNPRGGCYYVEAYNAYGSSALSNDACALVPETSPAGPSLISPIASYVSYEREIEFQWQTVPDVNGYVICVVKPQYAGDACDFNLDPRAGYISWISGAPAANGQTTLDLPAELAPNGALTEFAWTVSACAEDAYDCVGAEEYWWLVVDLRSQLVAPNLLSPPDGFVSDAHQTILTWEPVPGATSYRICMAYEPGDYCPPDGHQTYMSAYLDPTTTSWSIWTLPGNMEEYEWTVGACDAAGDCVWQQQVRSLTVDRRFDPPALVSAVVDPADPGRFTFSWNLVQGASRYIICVAEPGANCEYETGAWYKSSILGPAVSTYPMDIPLWLAPDEQVTNLNWTVAACNDNLDCTWQPADQPIVVDRT